MDNYLEEPEHVPTLPSLPPLPNSPLAPHEELHHSVQQSGNLHLNTGHYPPTSPRPPSHPNLLPVPIPVPANGKPAYHRLPKHLNQHVLQSTRPFGVMTNQGFQLLDPRYPLPNFKPNPEDCRGRFHPLPPFNFGLLASGSSNLFQLRTKPTTSPQKQVLPTPSFTQRKPTLPMSTVTQSNHYQPEFQKVQNSYNNYVLALNDSMKPTIINHPHFKQNKPPSLKKPKVLPYPTKTQETEKVSFGGNDIAFRTSHSNQHLLVIKSTKKKPNERKTKTNSFQTYRILLPGTTTQTPNSLIWKWILPRKK